MEKKTQKSAKGPDFGTKEKTMGRSEKIRGTIILAAAGMMAGAVLIGFPQRGLLKGDVAGYEGAARAAEAGIDDFIAGLEGKHGPVAGFLSGADHKGFLDDVNFEAPDGSYRLRVTFDFFSNRYHAVSTGTDSDDGSRYAVELVFETVPGGIRVIERRPVHPKK
jgi:hypothetical protein